MIQKKTTNPVIEVRGLRKIFRLYPDLVRSRIKQYVFFWKKFYREKIALDEINLSIGKGEIVGVIGPNGAGKSTLLKIIAGISMPTSGTVEVRGRVVTVLALGLGFHPRLSGLENIELAGMMLGMTRQEIRERRDWIIDFAELRDYISQPMNAYSTGMRARLSFAVAACQEPEILIIDEALATGDVRFVQKCIGRIQEITQSGTTALFVSHSISSIKRLTNRCILIDGGRIVDDGDTGKVADRYYQAMLRSEILETTENYGNLADANFVGTGEVRLLRADIRDTHGRSRQIINAGEQLTIMLELEASRDYADVGVTVACWRNDGVNVTTMGYTAGGVLSDEFKFENVTVDLVSGTSTLFVKIKNFLLAPGDYHLSISIFDEKTFSGSINNQQFYFNPRIIEFGIRMLGNPNRGLIYYQPAIITQGVWSDAVQG